MLKPRSAAEYGVLVLAAAVAGAMAGTPVWAGQVQAETSAPVESSSVTADQASASLDSHHHYNSPAGRANDALMITEVASALIKDGIARRGNPIIVDCDHGKILLTGVVKSPAEARRAGNIAAREPGVVAVTNRLTWQ